MDTTAKCLAALDFAVDWKNWRTTLKKTIESSRTYYADETVQNLLTKLDTFLNREVCVASEEEQLLQDMWAMADPEERKVIARLLLKTASRY